MTDKLVIEQIKHYQRDIIKCPENSKRMIRCIERLFVLPVTIAHLQETGVGRSVNELRKFGGEVGAAANSLVCKWKSLVKDEEEVSEAESDDEVNDSRPNTKCKDISKSQDCKNTPHRSESPQKTKPADPKENTHTSVSNRTKQINELSSESRSLKSSKHKSLSQSEHHTHEEKSRKSNPSSNSSKYTSNNVSKNRNSDSPTRRGTLKESYSVKENVDRSKSRSNTPSDKSKSMTETSSKEKHKLEERSRKYINSKRYRSNSENLDCSDDDMVYKPTNRKHHKPGSAGGEQKYQKSKKTPHSKESYKNKQQTTSEDSNSDIEAFEAKEHAKSLNLVSENNSESEDISVKSEVNDDNSNDKSYSNGRSSAEDKEDSDDKSSENSSCSEEEKEEEYSPDRDNYTPYSNKLEQYVPIEVKREKESPQRHSSSHKENDSSAHGRNSYKSSSSSKISKLNNVVIKTEKEDYSEVKVKKERVDKENDNLKKDKYKIDMKHRKQSSHHHHKPKESSSKDDTSTKSNKKLQIKIEKKEDGSIDCESGASFADALLGLSQSNKKSSKRKSTTAVPEKPSDHYKSITPTKHKTSSKLDLKQTSTSSVSSSTFKEPDLLKRTVKLEPLDVDLKATLPEISPNYKPLPHYSPPSSPVSKKTKYMSQEEALSTIMSTKNQRTKVYSGNKTGYAKVPSLFELCTQVLRDNIEALEYTGGVPYDLLKPVLDRATADQLYQLEHFNPYLIEDTDGLWQFHCSKEFRGRKPEEFETWRELYLRCLDEREKKLEALKTNITQSMAKSNPKRQTKLAYVDTVVKPPRNVAKSQVKYGTAKPVKHDLVAKAMLGTASGSSAPAAVPVPAPSRANLSTTPFPIPNFLKKKKAPLMAKALQLIKGNRFKR